jgi:hypothetical protein
MRATIDAPHHHLTTGNTVGPLDRLDTLELLRLFNPGLSINDVMEGGEIQQ